MMPLSTKVKQPMTQATRRICIFMKLFIETSNIELFIEVFSDFEVEK